MSRRLLIILLVAALAGAAAVWFGGRHEDRRCHVILIVIDTCRADHVGFGGLRLEDGSSPTPHLDALAEEASSHRFAFAPVPLTLPSATTIMSGLYPDAHGVRENDSFKVAGSDGREWSLLAEDLRQAGYRTAGFVSGQPLERRFGLDQGFAVYDQAPRDQRQRHATTLRERPAERTTEAVLRYLERPSEDPLFLFVHYFDPHAPYEKRGVLASPPEDRSRTEYVDEIAAVDAQIGRLLAALPDDGRERLVIVVGDHGEGLHDHGEPSHGFMVYDTTLRVPFLLKLPAGSTAPHDAPARLVDVYPTVLDAAGVPALRADTRDGRSLLSSQADWTHRGETLYGYYQMRCARVRTIRDRRFKLIEAGPRRKLFDWVADPGEENDLAAAHPEHVERLADLLLTQLQNRRFGSAEFVHIEPSATTPYMGARTRDTPLEPTEEENAGLPLAEDSMAIVRALETARALIRQGEFGRAALLLDGFEKVRDRHPALLFWTARAHQRCDEVEGLSFAARNGRLDRAQALFERHVRLFGGTRAKDSILRVRMRRSRLRALQSGEATGAPKARLLEESRAELEAIVTAVNGRKLEGDLTVIALASQGQAHEKLGRSAAALASFEAALKRDPRHPALLRDVARLRQKAP